MLTRKVGNTVHNPDISTSPLEIPLYRDAGVPRFGVLFGI